MLMTTDLLIDTNLWIYAMDKKSAYRQSAQRILLNPNHNLFITSKNISEFFAVTSKQKIDFKTSWSSYQEIKSSVKILFPNDNTLSIFENLIQQYRPKGNQIFDLEIVSIMLDNGITETATFNKKDFNHISEISNPRSFLKTCFSKRTNIHYFSFWISNCF